VNNLRAQFQLGSPITEFDPVVFSTQFSVPISGGGSSSTFTSGTSQSALLMNHQYEVNDVVSASLHRHQLSFGTQLIFAHTGGNSKEFGGPVYLGKFTYNTCTLAGATAAQVDAYCESSAYLNNIANVANYSQSYGNANYTVNDALYAVFAQDDYRLSNRLTVNLGLRYEGQTFTDAHKNFAPRVGFDLDAFGTGRTIIRGGFGIYYSQIVDNEEASYALTGPTGVFSYTATPGQVGFPTSIAAAPLPSFPTGAVAPLRSLYIRPSESAYLNQFLPTSTLVGYPSKLLNPYSEQAERGLRWHPRIAQSATARRGRTRLLRTHGQHHRSLGDRNELHPTLLGLLLRAERHELHGVDSGHTASLQRHPERRERWLSAL
jgi:hypothetical protein